MRGRGWAVSVAVAAWAVLVVGGGSAQAVPVVEPPPAPPSGDVRFDWDAARAQMRSRQAASRLPGTALGGASSGQSIGTRIAGSSRSVVQSFETGTASVTTTAAGSASKFGTVVRGAGTVLTAAFALDLTYSAFTGGFGGGFGFAGLTGYDSQGLFCDVTLVLGSSLGCGPGPATGYVANSDLVLALTPAGWQLLAAYVAGSSGWPYFALSATASVPVGGAAGEVRSAIDLGAIQGDVAGNYYVALQAVARCKVPAGVTAGSGSVTSDVAIFANVRGDVNQGVQVPVCRYQLYGTNTWAPGNWVVMDYFMVYNYNNDGDPMPYEAWWQWRATDDPARVPAADTDPVRWWTTTWLCEGGSPQSAQSATWHETDSEWPVPVEPSCDGSALASVTVTEEGTGLDPWVLYEWTLPVELSAWAQAYPECTGGGCLLELHYVDPVSSTRLACFDSPELCLGWFEAPLKADLFVCTYGSHDVALAECNMYAPTFDPARWPASGAAPYADPETGEAAPAPVVDPVPAPTNGCPPPFTWTSLVTPWWYYKGTLCALEAAFVPPAGLVQSEVGATSEILSARPPWSLVGPIGAVFTGLGDGWSTGCSVLADFDPYGHGLRIPCDPPQSAWMTVLRALGTFVVVVGAGFGVWHMVVAAIGGRAADS